jgi:hypothetical protein
MNTGVRPSAGPGKRPPDILRNRRGLLATLVTRLMEQEVVEGAEVRALVERTSEAA